MCLVLHSLIYFLFLFLVYLFTVVFNYYCISYLFIYLFIYLYLSAAIVYLFIYLFSYTFSYLFSVTASSKYACNCNRQCKSKEIKNLLNYKKNREVTSFLQRPSQSSWMSKKMWIIHPWRMSKQREERRKCLPRTRSCGEMCIQWRTLKAQTRSKRNAIERPLQLVCPQTDPRRRGPRWASTQKVAQRIAVQ